ncbi:MAG TPA: phosphoenolpyruvate--protein phosphotransferase [Candidatus Limnocylindria bacterium]
MTRGPRREVLRGIAAAPGAVTGRAVIVERQRLPPPRRIDASEVEAEVGRLRDAAAAVAADSDALAARVVAEGAGEEAGIFAAQAEMARDPELVDAAAARIRADEIDGIGAIAAAAEAAADMLRSLDDELLAGRAADVLDVADRIARRIAGLPAASVALDEPSILVAGDLAPSVTATLPRERLLGIVLEGSSATAHAAILARAYGIPAAVGVSGLLAAVRGAGTGTELMLDGASGEVVIGPNADDRARLGALRSAHREARTADLEDARLPALTRDGTRVSLLANIGLPDECGRALELGAEGVGLFRTEFLFLERSAAPSEDEQADAYATVAEAFAPNPVTIRLLDIGGDKLIPYLPMPHEDNPFLGVRALRLARERPELFVTQLRACRRAALRGRVKVMAPMVADAGDVDLLIELDGRARDGLAADGVPAGEIELGVMLEIPSAVLVADSYLSRVRFASLGTNDLAQYALAVDRGNPALERYRDALHPGILRLIRTAVEAGARSGVEVSVCGEMAGDPAAALALVGTGIRSLSMGPGSLPAVRRAVRAADLASLAEAAAAALLDSSASDVRARFAGPA